MNYWLVKFVPFRYSGSDVLRNNRFEKKFCQEPGCAQKFKKMKMGVEVLFS